MCGLPAIEMGHHVDVTPQSTNITAQTERPQLREVRDWRKATRAELEANAPGLTVSKDDVAILTNEILSGNAAAYY